MAKVTATTEDFYSNKSYFYRPVWWLVAGIVLMVLSIMRFGAGALAWFAPVPFMVHAATTHGWRARGWLALALLVATHLAIAKIITPPLSFALVPMFALPAAISLFLILLLWQWLRRRAGRVWALYSFPALIVVGEWSNHALGEFGTWGALATTQLYNLPLLQNLSLFGMSGIAFLMSWAAVLLTELVLDRDPARWKVWRRHLLALFVIWMAAHVYGSIRLVNDQAGPVVRMAAVSTDFIFKGEIPESATLARNNNTLFARSHTAARLGAKVIVWNEGATLVDTRAEEAFVARARALARTDKIHLVLAYIVPKSIKPFVFENKYLWIRPDGTIAETYFKNHPVPGEGSIKGTAPLKVIETAFGKVAGAICYDYDFPAMGRAHSRLGAGLVVVPSSDWRGIDPIHGQMASLRAIEGGFSLLRSVRGSASMGFDAYGRVRGRLAYFEDNDRILIVSLPTQPVTTLYSRIGDVVVYLCLGFIVLVVVRVWGWLKKD